MNLEMFYPMCFFADLMGSWNKFSFVAQAATLGNFFNFHKSKMDSGCHLDNVTFEPLVLQYCVITLFGFLKSVESIYDVICPNQGQVQGQM